MQFYKGWFEDTLPHYKLQILPSQVLVLFLDADLYSSTRYVLRTLSPHITLGTILYFDEFWGREHELKAFSEFIDETGMRFRPMIADYGMRHIAFTRTDSVL